MTTGVLATDTQTETQGSVSTEARLVRWCLPIGIFLLSRVVSTLFLVQGVASQVQLTRDNFPFFMARDFPARPAYLDLITTWDGQFYRAIADDGYLDPVAGDPQAAGRDLAWQFPPGFPMLARAISRVTGADFALVATLLNTVLGALAMVALYALVRRTADRFLAVAVVTTTSFFVSSPLLQMAYSESLALLLLALALLDVSGRRYLRGTVWVVLLAFTRIVTPPLLVVLVVHLWMRRRRGEGASGRDLLRAVPFALASLVGPFLWSRLASSFRQPGEGVDRAADVARWAVTWFGEAYGYLGWQGVFVMVVIVMVVLLLALSRTGRALGPELSTWLWAYPFLLFAVTIIQPGMIRYLLLAPGLLVPLFGPLRRTKIAKWVALVVVVALLVVSQKWFVDTLVVIDSLDQGFGP